MRRTARALSAAVLAGAALGACAGPVAADPGVPPPPAEPGVPPPPAEPGEPVAPPSAADPAAGEASARVSPADVAPGETVTVSVSCGPAGETAPATLDASSAAFDGGTVALRRVTGDEATASGPSYRGTARIAPAEDFGTEQGATDPADPADPAGLPGAAGPVAPAGPDGPVTPADRAVPVALAVPKTSAVADDPAGPADRKAPAIPEDLAVTDDPAGTADPVTPEGAAGREVGADDWTVDGACPDASGGEGDPWSATMTMPEEGGAGEPGCRESTAPRSGASSHGTPCATTKPPCPEPAAPRGEPSVPGKPCQGGTAEHGVHAGAGGSLSGSVPALVAGGVLIAGACGAAAHRLRLRLRGADGER
ncbi:hypothetical protein [Streptomyces olivaceus]|uniref:hypothetical protein n=1 Tax=Streptomyces olivaceus TaxID=47716 RepID=UPI001CCEC574|nr:hypothetical protein [Streptomyces olivaceus]MBZ6282082.1 hypothetical protein [Streptomyces olivaceus]